jgi:G:T-mismatch repair DNA endonuclease (very short patch repair protein)
MENCAYCDYQTDNKIKFAKHVLHEHKQNRQNYLIQTKYNGTQPICQCGCGELMKYNATLADFPKYNKQHLKKISEGKTFEEIWGDPKSEKRIKAISDTRKTKFASGEYNHILKHVSQKRPKNTIDKISKTKKKQWETGDIGKKQYKPSKLEKTFTNILEILDISYQTSFYAKEIKAFYDIFLPCHNILIEVDGDFWHCNPVKYPNGPTNKCQTKNLERDKEKNQWALENGYKLLRFWEEDINNNIKEVKRILMENLSN